jgi:hypothetical protein
LVVTPAKDYGYTVLLGQDFVVGDEAAFDPVDDFEHKWCFGLVTEQVLNK